MKKSYLDKKTDKRIESAYYRSCAGVQIDVMLIGAVFDHGRTLCNSGASDAQLESGLREFVDKIRG